VTRRIVALVALALLLVAGGLGGTYLWAGHHLKAAREALERHRPDEAREHLATCLRVYPYSRRPEVHLLAARAAWQSGDYDAADDYLTQCQRLEGEPSTATTLEWALMHADAGDLESVEEPLLTKLDEGHPETRLIAEALTRGYLRTYRVLEALRCLQGWLERWPDDALALYLRGQAWQRVHNYKPAADDFRRAVELEPWRDEARLHLIDCLLETEESHEAGEIAEELARRKPHDLEVNLRWAFVLHNRGEGGRARQVLDDVLRDHPDCAPALAGRARLALEENKLDEADESIRESLRLAPNDRQANYLYFQVLEKQGRRTAAAAQKARLDAIEAAIRQIIDVGNRGLAVRPNDPQLQAKLGSAMLTLGQEEVGLNWLRLALRNDPGNSLAHTTLADYYERHQDEEQAAYHRRLAGPKK
jgi:predicted Zn-dependent protease